MSNKTKDEIVSAALDLLAKHEHSDASKQFVTATEIKLNLGCYKNIHLPTEYIGKVLDGEFSQRYNGKEVVYFLKLKK